MDISTLLPESPSDQTDLGEIFSTVLSVAEFLTAEFKQLVYLMDFVIFNDNLQGTYPPAEPVALADESLEAAVKTSLGSESLSESGRAIGF